MPSHTDLEVIVTKTSSDMSGHPTAQPEIEATTSVNQGTK